MKVALVHDYLKDYGGAERVLEVLHSLYPEAPVYVAFIHHQGLGSMAQRFAKWEIRTTAAQNILAIAHFHHTLRFLIPYFWETLDLSEFDLVISSSSGYLSKSVLTRPETCHITYCHTPPRYLWVNILSNQTAWYRYWYETWVNTCLRQYDFYASQRVDQFIANSHEVAKRIHKFYGRSAEVIPPPVHIQGRGEVGDRYYLYVGRLSRPKQVDLAVQACMRLNRPLWIVGTGSEKADLQRIAGPKVRFLGFVPDDQIAEIYAGAKALIFPCAHEDFGIVPVEAMGHGIPVIALNQGGARETVLPYQTGLFFSEATVDSLSEAIQTFERLDFSSQDCIRRAQEFSESVFRFKIQQFIAQSLAKHQAGSMTIEPAPLRIPVAEDALEEKFSSAPLPQISVVVPIYNSEETLPALIQCLLAQTYPGDRVEYLLVDNASSDRTADLIKAAVEEAKSKQRSLCYLSEVEIQSSYAARNRGIRAAIGEILVFTDADCQPQPDWLEILVQSFTDPTIGLVVGAIRALTGNTLLEQYAVRKNILAQENSLKHPFCPFGQTANLAVRRSTLKEVGLFRSYLTTGGDADLCWRIQRQSNWKMQFAEQAIVQHRHRTTLSDLLSQFRRYGRSNLYLHELHGVGLTHELKLYQYTYRLSRWLVRELPLASIKLLMGKAIAVELLISPIYLLTVKAHSTGQREAVLPEKALQVEQL